MNILLASLKTLPKLVNGKVIVLNNDNTYTAYNPARGVTIDDIKCIAGGIYNYNFV